MTKYIKLFCIILVMVMVIYMLLDVIPMYLYNSTTTGKQITNIEDIEVCKRIVNKKYETILYGRVEELKKIYTRKYHDKIENFSVNTHNEELLNNFYTATINKVYKKLNNVYIVKHVVNYLDNSDKEFTMIIKMNWDKSKATILYDDMFN